MVMPLGFDKCSQHFHASDDTSIKALMGKFLVVYFDDILIYSKTLEHQVGHLRQVCHELRNEQLYVNPKKCVS